MKTQADGAWYRVVERPPSGVFPFVQVRLHPEGWSGRDLCILVALEQAEPWGLGSLHLITPEQRARWRSAEAGGLLA